MLLKLKFMQNAATLDIANNGPATIIFKLEELLGILDLNLLKIKQGVLQQNLSKYYKFKRVDTLHEHFNKFINTLKGKGTRGIKKNYPWLHPSNER